MKIELKEISIREVSNGYSNNAEEGVFGYDGKLNIRPKYQREYVYKDKQRDAVIETLRKNFPLNTIYWADNGDGTYEVMDGQQRTISICEYIKGSFSLNYKFFHNLTEDEKEQILNYKLMIYFCEGKDSEKLDWFRTINIAGVKLSDQELRNAIYTGPWLTDAKRYFSKTGCPAYATAKEYMAGSPIRQDYLETVLRWISNDNIEKYMSENQHEKNATKLWLYFQEVINWVKVLFPKYRKEMNGISFGTLYNQFRNENFDPNELEQEISKLMQDEDVTKRSGIYYYVLTRNEKYLNLRSFSNSDKRKKYEEQEGKCVICGESFEFENMEADHITPWSEGGKTTLENCQMLCKHDNRTKSNR